MFRFLFCYTWIEKIKQQTLLTTWRSLRMCWSPCTRLRPDLQVIGEFLTKELSFCHKHKFSNLFIFAIWWCKPSIIKNLEYVIWQNQYFEISKVYGIGLQSYRDKPIWACGKKLSSFILDFFWFWTTVRTRELWNRKVTLK